MLTVDLTLPDSYYTQSSKIVDAISRGESLERFEPSPKKEGAWAPYFLPFNNQIYKVLLRDNGSYLILPNGEYTTPRALWEHEFLKRKKVPDEHQEPCFICMPGLTVYSDKWVICSPTEVAWYKGARIMFCDTILKSKGGSQYPKSVQTAALPPSAVKGQAS